MTVKLIGNSANGTAARAAAYAFWAQFTCLTSGTATEVLIYSTASGYAKVGIYADNGSNYPGARLAKRDTTTAVTASQWNTLALEASCALTLGTKYWLCCIVSASGAHSSSATTGGVVYFVATAYAAWTWPANAPGGLTANVALMSYQGYGTTAGWGHIAKVNGVVSASISKINGVAVAAISKINGVVV